LQGRCLQHFRQPHLGHVREGHPEQRADTLCHRGRDERARQPCPQLSAVLEWRAEPGPARAVRRSRATRRRTTASRCSSPNSARRRSATARRHGWAPNAPRSAPTSRSRSAAPGRAKRQASMLAPSPSSARCSTAARHLAQLAIIGERLPISIADDEAPPIQLWIGLLDRPGRREAARRRHGGIIGSVAAGGAERSTATSAVSSYLMQINAAVRLHGP